MGKEVPRPNISSMVNCQWNATPYDPDSTISACLRSLSGYLLLGAQQAGLRIDYQRLMMPLAVKCIVFFNKLTLHVFKFSDTAQTAHFRTQRSRLTPFVSNMM
jgi:hypothetical protein